MISLLIAVFALGSFLVIPSSNAASPGIAEMESVRNARKKAKARNMIWQNNFTRCENKCGGYAVTVEDPRFACFNACMCEQYPSWC